MLILIPDIVTIDLSLSTSRREQSCEHGHGGRLPRPVVSQQSGDLTLKCVEGDTVYCHNCLPAPEHLPQAMDLHTLWFAGLCLK